ncbi:tRNA threonylcarbamoyladenosine dehydratase [Ileibacterium valens]|uniref:tRNA threonylcarbamoyladenosine dehydratase n=1 Tax=Ileibacterium valens TaxID=1862668 RepID=UPI0023570007|nr:tRNA threonylcarbamoyladenosine dehydratase [Ileibacterium valens]
MSESAQRTALLLSEEGLEKLKNARILVCGTGGVGSFAVEALARTGIGSLILIDKDVVEASNINRQLPARLDTIGKKKVHVLKEHVANLNPEIEVIPIAEFYDENMNELIRELHPDFILDCIDSIKSKKDLIQLALNEEIPIISSMGMARKKDPSQIEVCEVEKTSYDPIAKNIRIWKRKNKIRKKIMVASSKEKPMDMEQGSVLPSAIFVPASAGLLMANYAVMKLLED